MTRGVEAGDGGTLVLEGHPRSVGPRVTVDEALAQPLGGLEEGPALGVDVEVDDLLEAPGARLAVEAGDQLVGVLVQELGALHQTALRHEIGRASCRERVSSPV